MLSVFIVAALATYGMAYTVARLDGPLGVFTALRNAAGKTRHAWIYNGVVCEICLSFWVGIPVALLSVGVIPHAALHWLGYVGFAVFANVALGKLRGK